jgi:NADH-quinone oxidoreductase subunit J
MIGTILFAIVALIAVVAAVGMLTSTNAVHAALFLVINLLCVALFFLGLNAPFLAMVQITVYAGAIMVLFLFVIMLLGAERVSLRSRLRWQAPAAMVLVVLLLGVTIFILLNPQIGVTLLNPLPLGEAGSAPQGFGSPHAVGELLFTTYMLPFQMVGILLLVAMIGAVVLAKGERLSRKGEGITLADEPYRHPDRVPGD